MSEAKMRALKRLLDRINVDLIPMADTIGLAAFIGHLRAVERAAEWLTENTTMVADVQRFAEGQDAYLLVSEA